MQIGALPAWVTTPRPLASLPQERMGDFYRSGEPPDSLSALQRFWRDYGVHPAAMLARATVDTKPAGGSAVPEGTPANSVAARALEADLREVLETVREQGTSEDGLRNFQTHLGAVAQGWGVNIQYASGAPIVNWGVFPVLEIKDWGGTSACHEMVHAVQCTIGGALALASQAAAKTGAATADEIRDAIRGLTGAERREAYQRYVVPMETRAYAHFEQTAFEVGGMFGKKSRDVAGYVDRLEAVATAFVAGYERACVPAAPAGLDARVYGTIGHVARTHGETALLLGGVTVGYGALARSAMQASPLLGAGALVPLGYVIYRSLGG